MSSVTTLLAIGFALILVSLIVLLMWGDPRRTFTSLVDRVAQASLIIGFILWVTGVVKSILMAMP